MRLPTLLAEQLNRFSVFACVLVLAGASVAPAQEPARTVFDLARQKVQRQDITKSAQLGSGINRKAFSDVPVQGGILVGFDVQLSKFIDHEIVHAIKPLYATETGEIAANEFGDFGNKPGKKKNPNLTRSFRIKAPQGFAVGGVTIRNGLFIDGMKLTFSAIKGYGLDTERATVSAWVGNDKHGHSEKTIGNNGMPIVGVFGNQDDQRVLALGIIQISAPVVVAPGKIAELPAIAEEPAIEIPPRKGDAENRRQAADAKPAADVPAEAEVAAKNDAVEKDEPKLAAIESSDQHSFWLPVAIFGVVSMVVFASCWLEMGGRREENAPAKSERRSVVVKKSPRKTPPPIPMDNGPDEDRAAKAKHDDAPASPRAGRNPRCRLRPGEIVNAGLSSRGGVHREGADEWASFSLS